MMNTLCYYLFFDACFILCCKANVLHFIATQIEELPNRFWIFLLTGTYCKHNLACKNYSGVCYKCVVMA